MAIQKGNLVLNILTEKCPHCGKGHVFEKKSEVFQFPVMRKSCEICDFKFDREPGYFIGAMYISYGLAVLQGLITFLICFFLFPSLPTIALPLLIASVILLFSVKNYKLSRIIYIHIFPW
ncbi:MAG: DUF983 domain-containing protein [bacterium]|nr:DUF983 domain-containing protein [bacterium]